MESKNEECDTNTTIETEHSKHSPSFATSHKEEKMKSDSFPPNNTSSKKKKKKKKRRNKKNQEDQHFQKKRRIISQQDEQEINGEEEEQEDDTEKKLHHCEVIEPENTYPIIVHGNDDTHWRMLRIRQQQFSTFRNFAQEYKQYVELYQDSFQTDQPPNEP